jgi:energy-coupling factor transporter transmembrane protein EcfT
MAELTAFGYRPGASLGHRADVRFKLVALVLLSLAGLNAGFAGLGAATGLLLAALHHIRLPLTVLARDLRYFGVLLLFVFTARLLSIDAGDPLFAAWGLSITRPGLTSAVLVCWRLAFTVGLGAVMMATTKPAQVRAALQWLLKPLPFVPAQKIATMISLVVRFVPHVLAQARETAAAQRARGIENRKNPLYRLVKFSIPLLRRIFEDADTLVLAMEARCYSESRTEPVLHAAARDWALAGGAVLLGAVLFWA